MTLERMERDSPRTKPQASYSKDAVTIDSNKVEILHDFLKSEVPLDLAATLIEVNVASLWSLMVDYKQIILNSGASNAEISPLQEASFYSSDHSSSLCRVQGSAQTF